jgi:hypothetical protein
MVNYSVFILCGYVLIHFLRWMVLIGLQILIVFIDFSILNIICVPVTIIHLNCVPIHIHMRYVPDCSPKEIECTIFPY